MVTHDVHCHFFSRRFFRTLVAPLKDFASDQAVEQACALLGWDVPGEPSDLARRWVDEMDTAGVNRAALIASVPGDAESVSAAVRRYPERFVGFFMVDPRAASAAQDTLRHLEQGGLQGVCLFPAMHGFRLDGSECLAVIETAAAVPGTVVFTHCGFLSVGVRGKLGLPSPFDLRLGNPLDLIPAARRFPGLPFIIPHFGAGFFREALMAADACPNIHFDTSSSNSWIRYCGLTLDQVFAQALAVVGPERIVFGSDSSFFPRGWNAVVRQIQDECLTRLGIADEQRESIFGGNFERLFQSGA